MRPDRACAAGRRDDGCLRSLRIVRRAEYNAVRLAFAASTFTASALAGCCRGFGCRPATGHLQLCWIAPRCPFRNPRRMLVFRADVGRRRSASVVYGRCVLEDRWKSVRSVMDCSVCCPRSWRCCWSWLPGASGMSTTTIMRSASVPRCVRMMRSGSPTSNMGGSSMVPAPRMRWCSTRERRWRRAPTRRSCMRPRPRGSTVFW